MQGSPVIKIILHLGVRACKIFISFKAKAMVEGCAVLLNEII